MCVCCVENSTTFTNKPTFLQFFAHKRKTRCQLMLHNSNAVSYSFWKTPIFLKSLWTQLSNKTKFGTIRWVSLATLYSGESESSRIGLIFDLTAGKGWNKKIKTDQFPHYFTAAYSKSFLFSTHGTTFQFILFTVFNSWLYQISWFSYDLRPSPVLAFVLSFVFVG